MKKKFFISLSSLAILLCSIPLLGYASGNSTAQIQQFKQQQQELKKYIPYYKNLATCTPYNSDIYKIHGKVNGQCHVSLTDTFGQKYDCNVPMTVVSVNSSLGKDSFNKLSNINFDNMENKNIEELQKIMKDFEFMMKDIQNLSQLESTILQYHCKN